MGLRWVLLIVWTIITTSGIFGSDNGIQPAAPCDLEPGCGRCLGSRCGHGANERCKLGLVCRFHTRTSKRGVCIVPVAKGCTVDSKVHRNGEKFSPDCRTECICQNGTYACSSKCPNEKIEPKGSCSNPKLIQMEGHCCRQWVCDNNLAATQPSCVEESTPWSRCSVYCGGGISYRLSNANPSCRSRNETRICQMASCDRAVEKPAHATRKKHSCKVTQRWRGVRLRMGPCVSLRRYSPKHCGPCPKKDICCRPSQTTTIKVEMVCNNFPQVDEEMEDIHKLFIDMVGIGENIWITDKRNRSVPVKIERPHNHRELNDNMIRKYLPNELKGKYMTMNYPPYHLLTDIYILRMEWVLKCECGSQVCDGSDPNKVLHRSHRTTF